ncbi:TetR/AcrR family transcriptional regulator [Bifidobacterium eulemuris]|uniref:TetR family transcriptional regulator n=1 Tax=Bifidobacterium eulemuris TaxID=1765219 RepID=A0A261GD77_9BIFI|nr:TetR family transcriptional regulator [Bifidobacterium eulemuris]OZG69213.1 transcriptional regulator TetR family [Bifidobacterium eulemuris]QOL31277.1 TetR family transcriptional regulator [Bifidobacterium eulemuris]
MNGQHDFQSPPRSFASRDLRVRKTYAALFAAFKELIGRKPFEAITVTELCDAAMIRTATFYKHFQDKYDFFSFMAQELRADYSAKAIRGRDGNIGAVEYCEAIIRAGFDFLEDNKELLKALDGGKAANILIHATAEGFHQNLADRIRTDLLNRDPRRTDEEASRDATLLAEMFIGAISQTSQWWFARRDQVDKDDTVARLTAIIRALAANYVA